MSGALAALAQVALPVHPAASPLQPDVKIGAGDLLQVDVLDTPELSGRFRVDNDEKIKLPMGDQVVVGGLDAAQTARKIEIVLVDRKIVLAPHVTVGILEYNSQSVTVGGEVKNPGVYPLLSARTIYDFVSAAGGVTESASQTVSIVRRGLSKPIVLTLGTDPKQVMNGNMLAQPGDRIIVARSGIVYVVGDVNRPGGFLVETNQRLSLLQAIALAQGMTKTADENQARLIRNSTGTRVEQKLRVHDILRDKAPDVSLEDGDILFIPSSGRKTWTYRGIDAAIQTTTGVLIYGRL